MERNTETASEGEGFCASRLSTIEVPATAHSAMPERPRFQNLPLSREDQVRLLFYAEALARLWWASLGEEGEVMPHTSALCAEVHAIIARAERRGATEEAA